MALLRKEFETYKEEQLLYSSMPKEDGLMPSTLTSGHMPSDVPMRPETLAPPKQVHYHHSTDSSNLTGNHPTDTNTTLAVQSMYSTKTSKMERKPGNG
ncbi:MAG: hypothetical protein ACK53Y_03295 [bacterium]